MFSFIIYVVYVYFIISYFIKLNVLNHDLSKTSRVAENTKTITFLGKYCLLNPMSRLPPKQVQIASTAFNVGRHSNYYILNRFVFLLSRAPAYHKVSVCTSPISPTCRKVKDERRTREHGITLAKKQCTLDIRTF